MHISIVKADHDRRSIKVWEGFVEKIGFEPELKEWTSDG